MKVTPLGCTVFGIFGQVISNLASFAFFSTWIYWITNGFIANIQRSQIHLGLCISALVFIVYSLLMSCHICYVIHHDFDNIRAYFWTRIHLFVLVVGFSFLSLVELSMYLEIINTQLNQLLKEIVGENSGNSSSAFPEWMEKWQNTNACCGILGYKDYAEYGDRKSVSSNCCRWNKDSVDEDSWKCGDGVLRMNYAFMEEKIYTKGCGADMKSSLKHISLYGCILASISTVFVVISSMFYLTFLQQYSQEQHMSRMKRFDSEEREQLKLLSKKRQQQQLIRNSSSNKGPAKAHGTKIPSATSQQSRSRSRSSSRSHKKSHISADMENVEYHCEEKCYIKNTDKKSPRNGSLKSKSCPNDLDKQISSRNTTLKSDKRETLLSTRSLPKQKRSKSRTASVRSNNEEIGEFQRDYRDYRENLDFPSFKSNENLFLNLIDAANSRRLSKNVSNSSSIDFQEDVLVPRVLTKKSKQVLFDQNSNIYYDREHDLSDDVSAEFDHQHSSENTTLDIKFTEEDDDDCDPGDVIVRQL